MSVSVSVSVTVIYKRALQQRKINNSEVNGTTLICNAKNRKNLRNTWAPQRYAVHKNIANGQMASRKYT